MAGLKRSEAPIECVWAYTYDHAPGADAEVQISHKGGFFTLYAGHSPSTAAFVFDRRELRHFAKYLTEMVNQ